MDAIALSVFVEPTVVPGQSSEAAQPSTPFGDFVAAEATSKEHDTDHSTDTPSDMAASQAGLMSAVVSQWLAQRDGPPSLPTFARGILEQRASVVPEAAVSSDTATTDESVLPVEGPPATEAEAQSPVTAQHIVGNTRAHSVVAERGPAPDSDSPDESPTPVSSRAHVDEPKVPIHRLMQYAADIDWTVMSAETDRPSADMTATAPSESVKDAAAKFSAPTFAARAKTAFQRHADASPTDEAGKSAAGSEASIGDEVKKLNPNEPKPAKAADRPYSVEQTSGRPASTPSLDSLPQPAPNAPTNPANTPSSASDNINIPSVSNISVAAESTADMPVKLVVATREGQPAEMQTLALHIAARWAKGDSRFTIRLDPPELGRIDVNLNVNSHGHAQAVLAVEKPQTLDLLLRDAPTLERALKDAGLELGGNLSFSLKEDARQNFAQGDQYSPPSRRVELIPTDAAKPHVALNASLVEQLYGSRMARLDITV